MSDLSLLLAAGLLLLAGIAIAVALLTAKGKDTGRSSRAIQQRQRSAAGANAADAATVAYTTAATADRIADCFKLAFDVLQIDYPISGEHAAVLDNVATALEASVHQPSYFPRRPMLLPKLLQALNDSETTRREVVRLIMEDPTLAGNVLQRANSAFYRVTPEPVENINRAVVLLGTEGLRGLMATAILQPVFRVPRGYFEAFANITWEQAERTSVAAEKFAKLTPGADPFVAQLLGLLGLLANIVLFRLTMDKYRDQPNVLPRADVFIAAIRAHRGHMASLIAATWELTQNSLEALQEQSDQIPPASMSPLGRCLYFGELCGTLATLAAHGHCSEADALSLLKEQGMQEKPRAVVWRAASGVAKE